MFLINRETHNRILSPRTREEELTRAQQLVADPENLGDRQLAEAWAVIGECQMYNKEPDLSESAYLEAIRIVQTLENSGLLGEGYMTLGDAMHFCGRHPKAIAYYRQAADVFGRSDESEKLIQALSQMAYSYASMGESQEERDCLETAIQQPGMHPQMKATLTERVALSLGASEEYPEAIRVYEKALAIYESEDFKRFWKKRLQNLSQFYRAIGDDEGAERTMKRA